jgi:shikimate kinase
MPEQPSSPIPHISPIPLLPIHPIFLIGFMGAGKTTLGQAAATQLERPFVDLDHYIEARAGRTVQEIFACEGEAAFRAREQAALTELSKGLAGAAIVACGGGAPCFGDNLARMQRGGTVVYLSVPPQELARRLAPAKAHRPLIAGVEDADLLAFISQLLARREPYYQQAKVILPNPTTQSLLTAIAALEGD